MDEVWDSDESFMNSLAAFSEMEGVRPNVEIPTPPTIMEWNARVGENHNASIFDTPHLVEEVTYVVSGRGRGGISSLVKPGEVPRPSANEVDTIRRKIREVAGPGFSNELIEQDVKAKTTSAINHTSAETKLPKTSSPKSNCSARSTPASSSRIQTPLNSSKRSSPASTPRKSTSCKSSISNSSRTSTSPDITEIESGEEAEKTEVQIEKPTTPPPPLSLILKMGRKSQKVKEVPIENLGIPRVGKKSQKVREVPKVGLEQNGLASKKEDTAEVKENIHINGEGNDYWWRNGNSSDSGNSDEPNSWRRRGTASPNRFFGNHWNQRKNSPSQPYNINSSEEFPTLK